MRISLCSALVPLLLIGCDPLPQAPDGAVIDQESQVHNIAGGKALAFQSKMAIDVDGSPRAYGPNDCGIDYIDYAGHTGDWWGVESRNGDPVLQSSGDPFPGKYYISTTTYATGQGHANCYVDAEHVPFIVLPATYKNWGVHLGDLAWVYNPATQQSHYAFFADVGPRVGEASLCLGREVGVDCGWDDKGKVTGMGHDIVYVVFPGSADWHDRIPTDREIQQAGRTYMKKIGGEKAVIRSLATSSGFNLSSG